MKKANRTWEEVKTEPKTGRRTDVGLIFPVCDGPRGDWKHFPRFLAELTRLGFPFVAHFDHCSRETKDLFVGHPCFLGYSEDDDPKSFFDESFRQRALDVLLKVGRFTHFIHMDVDETLERGAPEAVREMVQYDVDVWMMRCLDLWGDRRHYRVDGVFAGSRREKVFRIEGNSLRYPHPTAHAPNVTPRGKARSDATVVMSDCRIHHWGIMDLEDARFHKERWDAIYTRKVGGNPYGGYDYYFDPSTVVKLGEIPEDELVEGVDR